MGPFLDFSAIGDAAVHLTNKLADGIGWIANRETPKKTAVNTYIEDIQNSNYDPVIKAALISNARKTIKEYCNQNNILEIAMQSMRKNAKPEQLDVDWLDLFMDRARLVSDEEFQQIWGKILATECNQVNSIPKVLLYILAQMDKDDAETFSALCKISVSVEDRIAPVVLQSKLKDYEKLGITFESLVNLNAIGLIEMDFGPLAVGYALAAEGEVAKVKYYDREYTFPAGMKDVSIGNIIYTKPGCALCKSIDVDKIDGFWEAYCLPMWEESERKNTAIQ